KAQSSGCYPDVLIAARRINDDMGRYVASELMRLMIKKGNVIKGGRILVLGFTFKENCPDLRNTRVIDLVSELREFGAEVDIHDPLADPNEARAEYGVDLVTSLCPGAYDGIVVAVAHYEFRVRGGKWVRSLG